MSKFWQKSRSVARLFLRWGAMALGRSNALVAHLPFYNAGYWSYYDLSGHLASPFYHRLHIAHLQALALAFPNHANDFRRFEETFTRQLANPMGKIRALVVKSAQKLRNLPQEVLE